MKTFRYKINLCDNEIKELICDCLISGCFDKWTKKKATGNILHMYVGNGGLCGENSPFTEETEQEAEKIFNKYFK